MSRYQWKLTRISCIIFLSILFYTFLKIKNYPYDSKVHLTNTHPNEVWEFVADFSNMKYLNPTIEDFNIVEESGNYKHWRYTVKYKEHLSHWPHLPNYAEAKFSIKSNSEEGKYYIFSTHQTCFLLDLICLTSESEFSFTHSMPNGVVCQEKITYQCPSIFYGFCQREVEYQRKAIMENLKKRFH